MVIIFRIVHQRFLEIESEETLSKLSIIKDGSIQGWFVSFVITIVSVLSFIGALFFDKICERFVKVGSIWATLVIAQFTAWLAYRAYTKNSERESKREVK